MRYLPYALSACFAALFAATALRAAETPTAVYSDPHDGFTLRYPASAAISTEADGQLDLIPTAAVVISPKLDEFKGTNLGEASVSVGVSGDAGTVPACAAGTAAQGEKATGTVTLGGLSFARFTFEDESAGDRYSSTSYRAVAGGRCIEIVEFLHWAPMENFSAGAIKPFDRAKIEAELHDITRSFALKAKAS
jgi:hypothetical protein